MFILLLYIFVYGNELNSNNFNQLITEYPYVMIHFYNDQCNECNKITKLFEQLQNKFTEKQLYLGQISCSLYQHFVQQFSITKYPTLIYFRFTEPEQYQGEYQQQYILKWLFNNMRPLLYEFEDSHQLKSFLINKAGLVYFTKQNQLIDPYIIYQMKQLSRKYSELYMILAKSPLIRISFDIKNDTELVIYPQEGQPKKYIGYLQDMENVVIEQVLPLFFKGTNLELQIVFEQQMPFFVIFGDLNQEIQEIAEYNKVFIRVFLLEKQDQEAIDFFSKLFEQVINVNKIYFYETKKKTIKIIDQIEMKLVLWDYIDREDGIKIDI